ncbi:MAG: hypothetical protein ACJ8R9_10730 [Steroidobacteraceae bacterium]
MSHELFTSVDFERDVADGGAIPWVTPPIRMRASESHNFGKASRVGNRVMIPIGSNSDHDVIGTAPSFKLG